MNNDKFFQPKPWLDLFETKLPNLLPLSNTLNPVLTSQEQRHDTEQKESENNGESPFTQLLALPSEVIFTLFSMLEAEQLCALAQASSRLLSHAYDPRHWLRIASKLWPTETRAQLERQLYNYKTWRRICTQRPRLRTNAIYVVRHQFAKMSSVYATEEPTAPIFLVTYFRFLRFYTDGTVVSLTTPELPHVAARRVRRGWRPALGDKEKVSPSVGTYQFDEHNLQVEVTLPLCHPRFPEMRPGTIYMHLSLSSTKSGAFDRLFLTEHHAIMDQNGGDLVPYRADVYGGKPFRLVPIWGFRNSVYREFPRDDEKNLAQRFEVKKDTRSHRNY